VILRLAFGSLLEAKVISLALNDHPKGHVRSPENRPCKKRSRTLTAVGGRVAFRGMANVLNNEKKQQILALGQLGWSLRRISGQRVFGEKPSALT
jgi:hypothetical protein